MKLGEIPRIRKKIHKKSLTLSQTLEMFNECFKCWNIFRTISKVSMMLMMILMLMMELTNTNPHTIKFVEFLQNFQVGKYLIFTHSIEVTNIWSLF